MTKPILSFAFRDLELLAFHVIDAASEKLDQGLRRRRLEEACELARRFLAMDRAAKERLDLLFTLIDGGLRGRAIRFENGEILVESDIASERL